MTSPRKVKVVLLGDSNVGKTCLSSVFVNKVFSETCQPTVDPPHMSKTLPPPLDITLHIWDTVGLEKHRSMMTSYMRGAHCAIIIFDVSDKKSFMSVEDYWIGFVAETATRDNIVMMLVANKMDLPADKWKVTERECHALAKRHGIPFFCTSAKDGLNVKDLFHSVAEVIKERFPASEDDYVEKTKLQLFKPKKKSKSKCC